MDQPAPRKDSHKVIYAAIAANLGIAVAKFIVAAITGSAAMVAEGIHSAVDTGNEFLLLLGERRSRRPADRKHPFGYGKSMYFWALIVALSVFSLGGGLSIYHGLDALETRRRWKTRCGTTPCWASPRCSKAIAGTCRARP